MRNKILSRAGSCLLLCVLLMQLSSPILAADTDTIYINDVNDFQAFVEQCSYDAWSEGKTVVLQRDLSLGGVDFMPIPSFGGSFEGNGHTISGLRVTAGISPAGLFGVVTVTGTVQNLTVEGSVAPSGSADRVGGIVGENRGTVTSCTFTGTVVGEKRTGGIAGVNAVTGALRRCQTGGGVFGKNMTGGTVGENHGTVSACTNRAYVNTNTLDPSLSLDRLETNMTGGLSSLLSPDTLNVTVDSGGVAGCSDGTLLGSANYGSVGYQHVGYNVGGVAGRSSGHIAACTNHGNIYGRREVGGVVGMAEPYIKLNLTESSVDEVRRQLNALSGTVDKTLSDAEGTSGTIHARLSAINNSVDEAENRTRTLTGDAADTYDETIAEINRGSEILDNTLQQLDGVTKDMIAVSESITAAADDLGSAMKTIDDGNVAGEFNDATRNLKTASSLTENGLNKISSGTDQLGQLVRDMREVEQSDWLDEATRREYADRFAGASDLVTDGFEIIAYGKENPTETEKTQDNRRGAYYYLAAAMDNMNSIVQTLNKAFPDLEAAVNQTSDASSKLTTALNDLEKLLRYLNAQQKLQFPTIGEKTRADADALYDSLHDISNHLELLNGEAKSASDVILNDVRQINRQFTALMNTLMDVVEDVEGASISAVVKDTSDEDIDAAVEGKVLRSRNVGVVSGDIDVGGVAGAMMVYNELDPENDEDTLSSAIRRRYELKCILQDCVNTGEITGKRDNVASVCGSETMGVIRNCEAYGSARSDGDYVGGVAGWADSIVRGSWAKCSLSGVRYVGGIVGGGKGRDSGLRVEDCRSLVEITDSAQFAGAVIGADFGTLRGNRFISDSLAGIDRVSRRGAAEPIDYETLLEQSGLPQEFRRFTLTFVADGTIIRTVRFAYGDSFGDEEFPPIPPVQGQYARWDREDLRDLRFDTVVTAVYAPCVTAVASPVTRSASRATFFVEGAFDDADVMEAAPAIFDYDDSGINPWNRLRSYRRTLLEQWQLTLPDDGADVHTVRYLPPEGESGHLELYLQQNGAWKRVETGEMGSYLTFEVAGGSAQLSVISTATPWWVWLLAGVFFAELVALLAVLLIRKRPKSAAAPEDPALIAQRKKQRRKLRLTLIASALALGAALGLVLRFAPAIHNGVNVYTLLRNYAERTDMEMALTLNTNTGGRVSGTSANIYTVACGNHRVSCVIWQDIPVYFCDDTLLLENGRAYRVGGMLPDYMQLMRLVAGTYNAAEVTLNEENGVKTYHAVAKGESAAHLLALLMRNYDGVLPETEEVTLELVVKDGELMSLTVTWNGEAGDASAELLFLGGEQTRTLPQTVRAAVESGEYANAADISEDASRLLAAWMDLVTRNTLGANVSLGANCGPLILDEKLSWQRTRWDGQQLSCLTRRGTTIYFTGDAACTDSGRLLAADAESLDNTAKLLHLTYEALLLGDADCAQTADGWRYTITLGDAAMSDFAAAIAPDVRTLDLSCESGSVRLDLTGDHISSISVQCRGSVRVVRSDVTAQLSARLNFAADSVFPEPSAAVREALALN